MQQNFPLPADQVVLCFSERDTIQLPANFCVQYFPREDAGDKCAPVKLVFSIDRSDWREFSLTIQQARKLLYFLRKVVTRRVLLPHSNSDDQEQ